MTNLQDIYWDGDYYHDYYLGKTEECEEKSTPQPLQEDLQEEVIYPAIVILNDSLIIVNTNNEIFTYYRDNENFDAIKEIVLDVVKTSVCTQDQLLQLKTLSSLKEKLINWGAGYVTVVNSQIYYKNELIDDVLSKFILYLVKNNDQDLQYWCNFLDTIQNCSSSHVYDRLFLFISKNDLAISKDGRSIYAWKVIGSNYKDKYTNTIDNSVGQYVSMPRNKVTIDNNISCSSGLHVASLDYLRSCYAATGDRLVIVKVNIEDIVSIPNDYEGSKIRVSAYSVVEEAGIWGEDIKSDLDYSITNFLTKDVIEIKNK